MKNKSIKKDKSIKFCFICREKNILNELGFLEENESYFCDECGKFFTKEEMEKEE